jgi:hypothetical protein
MPALALSRKNIALDPANFQPTAVTDATSRPLARVEHRTDRGE